MWVRQMVGFWEEEEAGGEGGEGGAGVLAAGGYGEAVAMAAGVLVRGYYLYFCGSGGSGLEVAEGTVVDRVRSSI
jgi:hypothetical protein